MSRPVHLSILAASIAVLGLTNAAQAETIEFTDTVDLAPTNWADTVTFPLFDAGLGDLISVTFELGGHVEGSARFESLDAEATTVTMNLAAEIDLERPDNSNLVTVLPLVDTSDDVTAFDGVIDFEGDSGRTYEELTGDDAESVTTTAPADLALFTGVGDIDLPAAATGASTGSGAGNLILQFATSASADVKVIYEYEPVVPVVESTWGQVKSLYR